MTEAIFPVFGPVLVLLGVLPLSALIAKAALVVAEFLMPPAWQYPKQELRFFLVVMASAAPLLWFGSASLHQAESGEPAGVCAVEHAARETFCPEPWFFLIALSMYCVTFGVRSLSKKQRPGTLARSRRALAAELRVRTLAATHPLLLGLRPRLEVRDEVTVPIAAIGALIPRVVLSTRFVEHLDDDALLGALLHEREHVRGLDPLRYLVASCALKVNPWGRMFLDSEIARWRFERELDCDREAVANGADATAIAHAIVAAARPLPDCTVVALGENDVRALKLRVDLLLAYAERPPVRTERRTAFGVTVCAAVALVMLPHGGRTWPLDVIHVAIESTILALTS